MTVDQDVAHVHVEIDAASDAYRARLHNAVQAWENGHALNADLQALVKDQRAAIRNYARTLTDVREALGGEEDADLVECVRVLVAERSAALAVIRAYKAGVADAEAMFAVLGEIEHGKSDVL